MYQETLINVAPQVEPLPLLEEKAPAKKRRSKDRAYSFKDQACSAVIEEHQRQLLLVFDAQKGCDRAVEELCTLYTPLLKKHAYYMDDDDFFNDCYCYLSLIFIDSIYRYDVSRRVPVPGFFKSRIHKAAYSYIRDFKRRREVETHHITTTALSQDGDGHDHSNREVEPVAAVDIAAQTEQKELIDSLRRSLHKLTPLEQYIIYEHYQSKKTFTAIAESLRMTKQDISYHHRRILTKLNNLITATMNGNRGIS